MNYLKNLRARGISARSQARILSTLRGFHKFLLQEQATQENPVRRLRSPRVVPRLPSILTLKEMEDLLQQPDSNQPLGIRDRAMLELLYAAGLRVSELVCLSVPPDFQAVGQFYGQFDQVSDDEVLELLRQAGPKPDR